MGKIEDLRERTYQETCDLLDTYNKACIIRPTGFGKTGILTKICKRYGNVLYLYPNQVVMDTVLSFYYGGEQNIPDHRSIPNVEFMTYQALALATNDKLKRHKNKTIVILDECHRLGADGAASGLKTLIECNPNIKLCGATASPERMDLVDEISMFFDNHTPFTYTLHDAFQDGILQRPYYVFCHHDPKRAIKEIEKDVRLETDKIADKNERKEIMTLLKARLIEISNLMNMDNVIKNVCNQYAPNTDYMKFIVFCRNLKHIRDKQANVTGWFQKAYPFHQIRTLEISSNDEECHDNVNKLNELSYQTNTIDLIFSCEMLNMGYHIESLTGILMYRGTNSGIVYTQQLGRALNSGSSNAGLVFDIMDNLHRETMYDVLGHANAKTEEKKTRFYELQKADILYKETHDVAYALTLAEREEYNELKIFMQRYARAGGSQNMLQPEDLLTTGYEATYREIIAKTVAEPISMRCRQAYAYWKERGGDDSTFTPEYVMSRQSPDAVPLSPFAIVKNVSVEAVLNEIFGPGDYHELVQTYCH